MTTGIHSQPYGSPPNASPIVTTGTTNPMHKSHPFIMVRIQTDSEGGIMTVSEDSPSESFSFCRIAVVDNDPMALASLTQLIREQAAFASLLWTSMDAQHALEHCSHFEDTPDILITDMSLEGIQGDSLCRRLRLTNTKTRLLAVTSFSLSSYERKARRAGAQGLVSKNDEKAIIHAIATLQRRESLPGFETPILAQARIKHEKSSPLLTVREEEVIGLVSERGLTDREIGAEIGVKEATVRRHMHNIMKKLKAKTARQAVAIWLSER